jgi:hypothetical protein
LQDRRRHRLQLHRHNKHVNIHLLFRGSPDAMVSIVDYTIFGYLDQGVPLLAGKYQAPLEFDPQLD